MRVLNVAEKPSMAKQIASVLSSNAFETTPGKNKYCKNFEFTYRLDGGGMSSMVMTSVLGHVRELDFSPEYSNWTMTPPNSLFDAEIQTKVAEDKQSIVRNLEIQARQAQRLVIWTDCDREGEHIGSEILQICRNANARLDVYRARYSSVTAGDLHGAMRNLQRLDEKQVAAVDARCELDLRSGAIFTRYQTLRLRDHFPSIGKEVVSYGPCQFPTLGFVVEQYMKVRRFQPEPFWYLEIEAGQGVEGPNSSNRFTWRRGHLFDHLIVLILYERSMTDSEGSLRIVEVEEKPCSKYRPIPLRTVEFQKAASRYLKISSDQVMKIAERLYNRGLISYPRTETDEFEMNRNQLRSLIQKQVNDSGFGGYARDLLEESKNRFRTPRRGKNNDHAHPPIHPTGPGQDLAGQERAVFEFVTRRFLACCSDDARGQERRVLGRAGQEEFELRGIRVLELNYLQVYKYEKWAEHEIGSFERGDLLPVKEYLMKEGSSTAPPLLNEADLITCMDKNGIGTDATIHEHIHKILIRKYAVKQGREGRFIPTRLGMALVRAFDALGLELSLTQPCIRAALERDLTKICQGQAHKAQVIESSKAMYRRVYLRIEEEFEGHMLRIFKKYLSGGNGGGGGPSGSGSGGSNDQDSGSEDDDLGPGDSYEPMPMPKYQVNGNDGSFDQNGNGEKEEQGDYESTANRGGKRQPRTRQQPSTATTTAKRPRAASKKRQPATSSAAASSKATVVSADLDSVNCYCGNVVVRRVVSKAGENQGKEFFTCSKGIGDSCKYFQWADDNVRPMGQGTLQVPQGPSFSGEMRCRCGLIMKQDEMRRGPDAGRPYATCSKIVQRCGLFVFLDGQDHASRKENSSSYSNEGSKAKQPRKKSKGSVQTCFKCNEAGHWANECPN